MSREGLQSSDREEEDFLGLVFRELQRQMLRMMRLIAVKVETAFMTMDPAALATDAAVQAVTVLGVGAPGAAEPESAGILMVFTLVGRESANRLRSSAEKHQKRESGADVSAEAGFEGQEDSRISREEVFRREGSYRDVGGNEHSFGLQYRDLQREYQVQSPAHGIDEHVPEGKLVEMKLMLANQAFTVKIIGRGVDFNGDTNDKEVSVSLQLPF